MSKVLRKLMRLSQEKESPIFLYDAYRDSASVLMDLSVYEREVEAAEITDEWEEELDLLEEVDVQDEEEEELSLYPQKTHEELALWKSEREEKEREEIARALEEELQENPPADPFEEDFVRDPQWHEDYEAVIQERMEKKESESEEPSKEPSYHPVSPGGSALSWTDWNLPKDLTPIERKSLPDIILLDEHEPLREQEDEGPIFLEEPL